MAPVRRRLSKRVVKSTFQECFEYDIPGFRSAESKRPSVPEARNRINISNAKLQQETTPKIVKVLSHKNVPVQKVKAALKKEKVRDEVRKVKVISKKVVVKKSEKLKKMQTTLASRLKVKSAFMGSDYKRFKLPQTKAKIKSNVHIAKKKAQETEQKKEDLKPDLPKNTSSSTELVFESTHWQPVVHLKKLSVGEPKSIKSHSKDKGISPRQQNVKPSRSPDLATRLKNALKDPMAEREDNESGCSDNEISNSMLVDEVLSCTLSENARAGPSQQILLDTTDTFCGEKRNLKTSGLEGVFLDDPLHKRGGSDSALEDWPESSEGSDDEDPGSKQENYNLDEVASPSSLTDWAGPHVNVILHWQRQFNCVTNELRNSFDSLKSIIEEKNSLIAALKNKLDSFNESTCHKILDRILLDYNKHDPQNPATMIINSILEYSNSHC